MPAGARSAASPPVRRPPRAPGRCRPSPARPPRGRDPGPRPPRRRIRPLPHPVRTPPRRPRARRAPGRRSDSWIRSRIRRRSPRTTLRSPPCTGRCWPSWCSPLARAGRPSRCSPSRWPPWPVPPSRSPRPSARRRWRPGCAGRSWRSCPTARSARAAAERATRSASCSPARAAWGPGAPSAWSALGLVGLRTASPPAGRTVSTVLAVSAANDFLQAAFRLICHRVNRLEA